METVSLVTDHGWPLAINVVFILHTDLAPIVRSLSEVMSNWTNVLTGWRKLHRTYVLLTALTMLWWHLDTVVSFHSMTLSIRYKIKHSSNNMATMVTSDTDCMAHTRTNVHDNIKDHWTDAVYCLAFHTLQTDTTRIVQYSFLRRFAIWTSENFISKVKARTVLYKSNFLLRRIWNLNTCISEKLPHRISYRPAHENYREKLSYSEINYLLVGHSFKLKSWT